MPIDYSICLPITSQISHKFENSWSKYAPTDWDTVQIQDRQTATEKKGTRPLKDNICYGEGRSVGQSDSRSGHGRKEGRPKRGREGKATYWKRFRDVDRGQTEETGCGNFGFNQLAFEKCVGNLVYFTISHFILANPSWTCIGWSRDAGSISFKVVTGWTLFYLKSFNHKRVWVMLIKRWERWDEKMMRKSLCLSHEAACRSVGH